MFKKMLKFGITGGLGSVTNLVLFYIFADKLGFAPAAVSTGCFCVACTQNYFINHLWTFKIENRQTAVSFLLWGKFVMASLCGLAVNLVTLTLLLRATEWPLHVIPQALGILAGMGINFICSNFFVFKGKHHES